MLIAVFAVFVFSFLRIIHKRTGTRRLGVSECLPADQTKHFRKDRLAKHSTHVRQNLF